MNDIPTHHDAPNAGAIADASDGRGVREDWTFDAPLCHFQPSAPRVSTQRILRIQGYVDAGKVRPAIARAAQEMGRLAQAKCEPLVAYRFHFIEVMDAEGLELRRGLRLRSAAFESRLVGCSEVVPFVLSCGEPLGQAVVDLAESGDLMEAVLLEAAGWLCVEDATRQFKDALRHEVEARGQRITSRMGPGYSYRLGRAEVDWPLENHPELFAALGEGPLPVRLMPSCAMFPKLSRSGLFGVAPALPAEHPFRPA